MDKNKIFVFSVILNPEDDILNTNVVYKACTERIKEFFPGFYIFTPADKLYKEAAEKYSDFINDSKLAPFIVLKADVIRMYILSKLQNALYIDLDIWLTNIDFTNELNENPVILNSWGLVYSGMNNQVFNKILDFYKTDTLKNCTTEKEIFDKICDYSITDKIKNDIPISKDIFKTYHYHNCFLKCVLDKSTPNETIVLKRFEQPEDFFNSVDPNIKKEHWFYRNGNVLDIPVTDISNYKPEYGQPFFYFNDNIWKDYQELKAWILEKYNQVNKPTKIIIDF